eukprot:250072_1
MISLESYVDTTNGWMSSLLNSLENPIYPRAIIGDWPLASGSACFTIILLYLIGTMVLRFVMDFLPSLDKYTYYLRFIYNPAQVFCCSYMFLEAIVLAWSNGYTHWTCHPFNIEQPIMLKVTYLFYISKIFDLCDTLFIILGKKWKQLSFLHVYHHCTIIVMFWINSHIAYDGDIMLPIALNGFVHSVMYMYYFVTMHQRSIWWKKFVTYSQMMQFVVMISQFVVLEVSCLTHVANMNRLYGAYTFSMLSLFFNFFKKEYKTKVV